MEAFFSFITTGKLTVWNSDAFSLVEVLLCLSLLGLIIISVALPQLYALRAVAQVTRLHQVNLSLDNLAAGLAASNDQTAFLLNWRQTLQVTLPHSQITQGALNAHSIAMTITWPAAPGMLAIGNPSEHNTLIRTVYF